MKKWKHVMGIAMATGAFCLTASGGQITNLNGQSCGDGVGVWHFVNVQTPSGSPLGTLTATWSSYPQLPITCPAYKFVGGVQHFSCTASGTLLSASTNLGGYLRLSDFTCEEKCEKDPKTGVCK